MQAIAKKMSRYQNPWHELKIQYGQNKGKLYNEECDRFMVCFVYSCLNAIKMCSYAFPFPALHGP